MDSNFRKRYSENFHLHFTVFRSGSQKFVKNIIEKTNVLLVEGFSEVGQIDDINPKFRRLIYKNYKILYTAETDFIVIHSVFDCRQNP